MEQPIHKSKLAGFIIDCQTDDLDRAADFWAGALGLPLRELPPDEAPLYRVASKTFAGRATEWP